MSPEKRKFELNAVSLLRRASRLLQDFELSPGADPPDVNASRDGEIIGIEVRRLFSDEGKRGSPQKSYQSSCQKVVDVAQSLHKALTDKWYVVRVHFVDSCILRSSRQRVIAEQLVAQVHSAGIKEHVTREFRSEELWGPEWPEEILFVSAAVFPGEGGPEWGLSCGAWVGETTTDLIQDALDIKESRLAAFPAEIHGHWLLLVCDGSTGASLLRLHRHMATDSYQSSFDRAFVMDFTGKHFCELALRERGQQKA